MTHIRDHIGIFTGYFHHIRHLFATGELVVDGVGMPAVYDQNAEKCQLFHIYDHNLDTHDYVFVCDHPRKSPPIIASDPYIEVYHLGGSNMALAAGICESFLTVSGPTNVRFFMMHPAEEN